MVVSRRNGVMSARPARCPESQFADRKFVRKNGCLSVLKGHYSVEELPLLIVDPAWELDPFWEYQSICEFTQNWVVESELKEQYSILLKPINATFGLTWGLMWLTTLRLNEGGGSHGKPAFECQLFVVELPFNEVTLCGQEAFPACR